MPAQNWGGNDRLSFAFSTCVTSGVNDSWNLLPPKSLGFWSLSSHWRTPITVIVKIGWGQVFSVCWWVLSQVRISIWNGMPLWLHFRDCWSRTPKQRQASHLSSSLQTGIAELEASCLQWKPRDTCCWHTQRHELQRDFPPFLQIPIAVAFYLMPDSGWVGHQ